MVKQTKVSGYGFVIRFLVTAWLAVLLLSCGVPSPAERPNILFIIVDDLRPELGCYGNEEIRTPHIDRFAQEALVFTRAYCQQAVCGASRPTFCCISWQG